MDSEEELKQDIELRTQALKEKVDLLKGRVSGSVEQVTQSVDETIQSVRDTFSLTNHLEKRPLAVLSASIGTGLLLGMKSKKSSVGPRDGVGSSLSSLLLTPGPVQSVLISVLATVISGFAASEKKPSEEEQQELDPFYRHRPEPHSYMKH